VDLLGIDYINESLINVNDISLSTSKLAIMLVISVRQLNWSSEDKIIYFSLFLEKIFLVKVVKAFLVGSFCFLDSDFFLTK